MGGLTTTATYYDGIRVPHYHLVGPEHGGWGLITEQLNHERVALAAIGMQAEDFFAAVLHRARTPDPVTGRRRVDEPWVRIRAAEAHARLAATRLLSWRLVGDVGAYRIGPGRRERREVHGNRIGGGGVSNMSGDRGRGGDGASGIAGRVRRR